MANLISYLSKDVKKFKIKNRNKIYIIIYKYATDF